MPFDDQNVFMRTCVVPASKIVSIADVRRLLAERFPESSPPPARAWTSGWPALDTQSAIELGAVAEVCSGLASGRLFLHRMLKEARCRDEWIGLIDPARAWDFPSTPEPGWGKVLVTFPAHAEQAVKVADALLRDANLPLVLLDLQATPLRALGRIPASTWHRFQRLAERSGTALVVLTPQPLVEAARVRITLRGRWSLAAMNQPRSELVDQLQVQVFRRGRAMRPAEETLTRSA